MGKDKATEPCYQLPEAAHARLCNARDEIRLLADLTARSGLEPECLQVSHNALARCFDRLADELGDALHMSFWPPKRD